MQRIAPCLWFDGVAEQAAEFYAHAIPDAHVIEVMRAPSDYPAGSAGAVLSVRIQMGGQEFTLLNGGPGRPFTEAVSFQVMCQGQDEVDRVWAALLEGGGRESQCGWLWDRYGLSWQVIPVGMDQYVGGPDEQGAQRAFAAMMDMVKLDIDALRRAYEGT